MKYKELKKRVKAYQDTLGVANRTIYNQMLHIDELNKQLAQQDDEFKLLQRMYRDDMINGFKS